MGDLDMFHCVSVCVCVCVCVYIFIHTHTHTHTEGAGTKHNYTVVFEIHLAEIITVDSYTVVFQFSHKNIHTPNTVA